MAVETIVAQFIDAKTPPNELNKYDLLVEVLERHGFERHDDGEWGFFAIPENLGALHWELEGVRYFDRSVAAAEIGQFIADAKEVDKKGTAALFLHAHPLFKDKSGGAKGISILYAAATSGNLALVRYLVETVKCDIGVRNVDASTPLLGAAYACICDKSFALTITPHLIANTTSLTW